MRLLTGTTERYEADIFAHVCGPDTRPPTKVSIVFENCGPRQDAEGDVISTIRDALDYAIPDGLNVGAVRRVREVAK
jgi:hypothetical protein